MENELNIGLRIKEIIRKRGISQKYLSMQTNTPETTMSGYLNGSRSMPFDVVCKISKELKLDLNKLFDIPSEYVMDEQEFEFISRMRNISETKRKKLFVLLEATINLLED